MKRVGFDTESTGLDVDRDRILSAALVTVLPNKSFESVELFLNPGVEISKESEAVHGLSKEFIEKNGLPPFYQLEKISQALNEADEIIIYNAPYDYPLLVNELKRWGLPKLNRDVSSKIIDPLVLDRHYDKYRKGRRNLESIADHYEVEIKGNLHDAVTDVETMLRVFDKMSNKYPHFLQMSTEDRFNSQALWHKHWAENFNNWKKEEIIDRNWLDNRLLKKWHCNLEISPRRCEAKYECPLDYTGEHYETEAAAEKGFNKMKEIGVDRFFD